MKREDVKPGVRVAWVGLACQRHRAVVDAKPMADGSVPLRSVEALYRGQWETPSSYTSPHYTWLRRLKPAKKRRRIWVTEGALAQLAGSNGADVCAFISSQKLVPNDVEFIEVRRKAGEEGK